jgi:hypothetical protein
MAWYGYDVHIQLRGENLPIKDSWIQGGKADPYVVLRKGHGEVRLGQSSCLSAVIWEQIEVPKPGEYMGEENTASWVYNGKNQYQKNTLDPKWPTIIVPLYNLCDNCDFTKPIVIDIWDYDFECPHDDFMGFCHISIYEIFIAFLEKKTIPLQPGKEGHKWGGNLIVEGIELIPRGNDSKLDPISPHMILHLVCSSGDADKTQCLLGIQKELVHERTAKTNFTPLHFAVADSLKNSPTPSEADQAEAKKEENRSEVVRLLLEAKADVFGSDVSPLSLLAKTSRYNGCLEVGTMLIDRMKTFDAKTTVLSEIKSCWLLSSQTTYYADMAHVTTCRSSPKF